MNKINLPNLTVFFLLFFSLTTSLAKNKEPKFVIKDGYKSITYNGLTYKGTTKVAEKSFQRARYIVDAMLENVPYIRTRLTEVGYKIIIMDQEQNLTSIPEYAYFKGKKAHQRTIGVKRSFDTDVPGMAEYELCVVSEKYLLDPTNPDIMVHEFAHAILFHMYKEDADIIQKIYTNAFEKRLFPTRTYLMNNYQEYWAVLSASWLGLPGKSGHDGATTAEKVKERDPKIAEFLQQIYGHRTLDLL